MNKLVILLISSFILILAFYLMLSLLVAPDGQEIVFALWIYLGIANLFIQPILLGYSTYYFFKIKTNKTYWLALFLIINTLLFLIPILFICLLIFSAPIDFQL